MNTTNAAGISPTAPTLQLDNTPTQYPRAMVAKHARVGSARLLRGPDRTRLATATGTDLTLFDGDRCPVCAGPLVRATTGRPATYCSATCRLRAHRRETKPEVASVSTSTATPRMSLRSRAAPADLAAIVASIATPVDAYGGCRAYCQVRDGGFGVVFGRDGGRTHDPAGPVFRRPGQAIDLANLLNARLAAIPYPAGLAQTRGFLAREGPSSAVARVHRRWVAGAKRRPARRSK